MKVHYGLIGFGKEIIETVVRVFMGRNEDIEAYNPGDKIRNLFQSLTGI